MAIFSHICAGMAENAQQQLLLEAVSQICKVKTTTKTKVMQDEMGRVYVFDCYHWSEECAYMLRFLCPNAVVSVEAATSSLSGFVIVLQQETLMRTHQFHKRMFVAIVFTLTVYTLIACLHTYAALPSLLLSIFTPFLKN